MSYKSARESYRQQIDEIKEAGLFKEEHFITSPQGAHIQVENAPQKNVLNFCSNNYLGLSAHPDVIAAAHEGLNSRGFGLSSVRFICGTQDIHRELEHAVSSFLQKEDTCLFASCFDANAAIFETILTKEDAVISDRLIHASLIDGIRLCKAQRHIFEHSDMNDLEEKLKSPAIQEAKKRLIVVDGVFSMDGDMAPLDEICDLADRYDAMVLVDDCHATGFIGENGRGTQEYFNVTERIDIITTTFGKALGGAIGGSISAPKEIITLLKQKARPYLFSNALMPAVVSATIKVFSLLGESSERRKHLMKLAAMWREMLTEKDFDLKPGNTPIVPVMLYDAKKAQRFSQELFRQGVMASGFFYPVVPKEQARIRTQLSAAMSEEDLNFALQAFIKARDFAHR